MYVVLCYDVRAERTGRMLKTARKYLFPAQRSVLEGHVTGTELKRLKDEIARLIVPDEDAVRIYAVDSEQLLAVEQIGLSDGASVQFL